MKPHLGKTEEVVCTPYDVVSEIGAADRFNEVNQSS
jgi:hypothetical protein